MSDLIVVGAGPTGLLLACELALTDVDVVVLERRETHDLVGTRARGFHSRTIELLDQRGIADRFLAEGRTVQAMTFADTALPLGDLPTRHPCTLALEQSEVERILRDRAEELGVPVRLGCEVTGFAQDDAGVDVHLVDGEVLRTAYLVGADGGRSVVRRTAGITMVGAAATRSHLVGEAAVTEPAPSGIRLDDVGIHAVNPKPDGRTVGLVVTEQELRAGAEPTLDELRAALTAAYGTDLGVHDPAWLSRFTDATRQAADYRRGRVLLAGDAAHVHPPTGGQGIGLGAQDAVALGWRLACVVRGKAPATLLDGYQVERHPATARVLDNVLTQARLQRGDARTAAVRRTIADLLGSEESRLRMAALLAGLDVRHDLGDGHPLLGRRMPDLDLTTAGGSRRVFELLRHAQPVLLDLAGPGSRDLGPVPDGVPHVTATYDGRWELPVVGEVSAPSAVLVRPDGHVAWVEDGTRAGLQHALAPWSCPQGG